MATIRAFTTIEQSRKLAEILPLESADMCYIQDLLDRCKYGDYEPYIGDLIPSYGQGKIRCWSLAALLEQLKSEIILENKQILFLHLNKYDDNSYEIRYTNSWTGEVLIAEADNPIDACVAMVEKLNELKVL